jgi:enolase
MEKFSITGVKAREILDSRGNPTVETDVITSGGFGRASVPSGASTGRFEAVELRDGGRRFHGKGVLKACENVNSILAPAVEGMDSRAQSEIDNVMKDLDGTENKAKLGANAILSVSLAVAKAAANTASLPLFEHFNKDSSLMPVPFMNIINGGKHAGNSLAIQEFMIVPVGASSFREALQMGSEVYIELSKILKESFGSGATNVGDEGGFAPPMTETRQALDSLVKAIKLAGYSEDCVKIAMDSAASNFFFQGKYLVDRKLLSTAELLGFYESLLQEYPVISLEDPFEEDNFDSFREITKSVGKKAQIIGDDLFVTNMERFRKGVEIGAANSLLMKVNQIGTLSESMEVAKFAFASGYRVMVSHRSGETEDCYIADLAVALGSGQIKAGAPARGERTSKYNQLLRIEELLGSRAKYPHQLKL